MGWVVVVDRCEGYDVFEFENVTEALHCFADKVNQLLNACGYSAEEVLRNGKAEDIEANVDFKPLLIARIDYDIREYDLVAVGIKQ